MDFWSDNGLRINQRTVLCPQLYDNLLRHKVV